MGGWFGEMVLKLCKSTPKFSKKYFPRTPLRLAAALQPFQKYSCTVPSTYSTPFQPTAPIVLQSIAMAHPRAKKRPHGPSQHASSTSQARGTRTPKSMVIRVGASEVGPHISQLVKDVRLMMEPDTAGRLKVWLPFRQFHSCNLYHVEEPLLTQRPP